MAEQGKVEFFEREPGWLSYKEEYLGAGQKSG